MLYGVWSNYTDILADTSENNVTLTHTGLETARH